MKDSPSPPPAPDPQATAGAQTQANINTAIANARLNRVNQQTPWGNITYTQGAPDANGVPTYSSQITLSPAQQQLLNQQQAMQLGRNQLAGQFLGNINASPLDLSHLHAINDRGQMYGGAVNAQGPAQSLPQQAPQQEQNTLGPDFMQQLEQFLSQQQPAAQQAQQAQPAPQPTTTPPASQPAIPAGHPNINAGAQGNPLDALLNGRPIHGTSGAPIAGLFQQALSGNGVDPRLYNYGFHIDTQMESPVDTIGNDRVDQTGDIRIHGKPYVQIENTNIGGPGEVIDPSQVIYDPEFGLLTPQGNLKPVSTGYGDAVFALGALGLGLPTAAAALGGAGGAASSGVGDLSTGDLGSLAPSGLGGTGGTAGADLVGGAPVVENSVQAANPSMWQTMANNFTSGHGLLGLSPMQRAGVGILPTLLRNMQGNQRTGGR